MGMGNDLSIIGQGLGLSHPSNPAASRGHVRSGWNPNRGDYTLGADVDPNWMQNFAAGNQQIQQGGANLAQQGSNLQTIGTGVVGAGGNLVNNAGQVQNRNALSGDYRTANGFTNDQVNTAGNQAGAGDALMAFANGPGPSSAAQAQLRAGTNDALNSQLAMARSGSGFGENSNALANAGMQASNTIAQQGNASAALRAQEEQAWNQQRLQAFAEGGNQYGAAAGQYGAAAGQASQNAANNAALAMNQRQLNDQTQLGLINSGAGVMNAGTGMMQAGFGAENQGNATQATAQQLNLAQATGAMQGDMAYENELSNLYAIDTGEHDKTRELNQSGSGLGTILGAVGGLAMLSDRRAKHNVRLTSLRQRYADLT